MKAQSNVLVVDDNPDLLDTFRLILKYKGYNVDTAADGLAALEKLKEQTYDVVLLDMIMPRMDGVEALARIRESYPGARVIIMTAYSEESALKEALANGAYCTLKKPVSVPHLVQIIGDAVSGPLILLVDDDAEFCRVLARAFELKGYRAKVAHSGSEAINIARDTKFNVALVDLKMPCMNGIETHLRLQEVDARLPTILMTGYREEMPERAGVLAKSAITCLYKPFDPDQVLALVASLSAPARAGGRDGVREEHTPCR